MSAEGQDQCPGVHTRVHVHDHHQGDIGSGSETGPSVNSMADPGSETMVDTATEPDSSSGGADSTICHCCGVTTGKARLHYGGVSCYPCRSFFRRATVGKRRKSCKKDGKCEVKLLQILQDFQHE